MKKLFIILSISAFTFSGCGPGRWIAGNKPLEDMRKARRNVVVSPSVPVAFKDIERANVVLDQRPGQEDTIIITVIKH